MKTVLTSCILAALLSSSLHAQKIANASAEQRQQWMKRFPQADTNQDGTLSNEEAAAFYQQLKSKKQRGTSAGTSLPTPSHADVSYGDHPNNKLDLWLAKSDKPTPLIVFIHGGGFVGGDKSAVGSGIVQQALAHGVSIASINYRFRTEAAINVVLRDCARAVQFLRSKAGEWNLDRTKVAAMGGSAGAGASMWLAFHDDLADPKAADPVLRESTRIVAAVSNAGQSTYDVMRWHEVLGSDEVLKYFSEEEAPKFYGLKTMAELNSDEGKRLRADADMLGLISKGDPPVLLSANARHYGLKDRSDINHTPKHSEAVKKRCDEVGVPAILHVTGGTGDAPSEGGSGIDFLLNKLGAAKSQG